MRFIIIRMQSDAVEQVNDSVPIKPKLSQTRNDLRLSFRDVIAFFFSPNELR